jgi:hypothetical protein
MRTVDVCKSIPRARPCDGGNFSLAAAELLEDFIYGSYFENICPRSDSIAPSCYARGQALSVETLRCLTKTMLEAIATNAQDFMLRMITTKYLEFDEGVVLIHVRVTAKTHHLRWSTGRLWE